MVFSLRRNATSYRAQGCRVFPELAAIWHFGCPTRPRPLDLGSEGIVFRIDRCGYDYGTTGPLAFSANLDNPSLTSFAHPTIVNLNDDVIEILVQGYLTPGDNLIVLADPNPGGVRAADPIGSLIGGDGGGSTCVLNPPACTTPGTCAPPLPASAVMGGATNCEDKWLKIGPEMSPACGSSAGYDVCTTHKGGVSFGVKIGVPGVIEFEVGANGEVSKTTCARVNAQGGWRVQQVQCYKICTRTWDQTFVSWHGFSTYHDHTDTSYVIPGGLSTMSCQFDTCGQ